MIKAVYTYARHEDEAELCSLELKTLFGAEAVHEGVIEVLSPTFVPSADRSPFTKRKLEVLMEEETFPALLEKLNELDPLAGTFKVMYTEGDEKAAYSEQRQLERLAGASIRGQAEMRSPSLRFGLMRFKGKWLFGPCEESDAVWLKHQEKPQNYSTALPTRAARAIVNIAAGAKSTASLQLIDPCCGMGTVLIEALSMSISIEGNDLNPLAVMGARANLAHFGYPDIVKLGDMKELTGRYDGAVVDMPYNLCSVLPEEESIGMLRSVKKLARRAVIVTTSDIENQLQAASFQVRDRACLRKGSFTRYINVVE
ncbi:TRM11 family SAM-dependent methyltransferase [Paenibacillus sp. GCM10027627]|uniref:TRM11 family SAM-dependent methyltransferase n=1 Tax=unclassified Paenibacillus TaxID=185978 RepID=UPI003637BD9B